MITIMRPLTLIVAGACVASLTSGCVYRYGMTARKLTPAHEAAGISVHIRTDMRQLSGELIALRDDGLLLVSDKVVRLVPYGSIVSALFDQTEDRIDGHQPPSRDQRERLRVLSRYPQGLAPDLLNDLLHAYGQGELAGID